MNQFEERFDEWFGGAALAESMEPLTEADWLCGPIVRSEWAEGPETRNPSVLWMVAAFAAGVLLRHIAVLL